ncbi:MAG: hypothetical protein LBQ87_05390 [Candidatus Fibromonas sp.]|nr:hypothetical protein [Candidatus Fibromonas sp.]
MKQVISIFAILTILSVNAFAQEGGALAHDSTAVEPHPHVAPEHHAEHPAPHTPEHPPAEHHPAEHTPAEHHPAHPLAQDSAVAEHPAEHPAEHHPHHPAHHLAQDSTVVEPPPPLAAEQPAEPPAQPLAKDSTITEPPPPVVVEQPAKENVVPAGPKHAWNKGLEYGVSVGVFGGISVHAGYRFPRSESFFKNRIGFRLGYSTLNPIWNQFENFANRTGQGLIDDGVDVEGLSITDSKFKADLNSSHFGILVDFHPFGYTFALGGLRFTAGYYFGGLDLSSKISKYKMDFEQEFESSVEVESSGISGIVDTIPVFVKIKGNLDQSDPLDKLDPLETKIKFKATGPYVGLGWDIGIVGGLHFTFDAGIISSIKPHYVAVTIPELHVPDSTSIIITIDDKYSSQRDDYLKQLEDQGYCNAVGTPACTAIINPDNDNEIVIPEDMIEKYTEEYGGVIEDFNNKIKEEKKKALDGKKSKEGRDGLNTRLKQYPYFPILRLGFMWRF